MVDGMTISSNGGSAWFDRDCTGIKFGASSVCRHHSGNIGGVPVLPHERLQLEDLGIARPVPVLREELRREGEDIADRLDR